MVNLHQMFFVDSLMSRVFRYLLLVIALVCGGGYTLSAQELKLGVDFATLFDNTEYASLDNTTSGTLFGARLTPQVGLEWQDRNQLMVGADLYQDFGHDRFLSKAKLQLYYAYKAEKVRLYAGIFPRTAMRGLQSPLFFDPAYCYYNNAISGVLARYVDAESPSYVEFVMDYTGMRSYDVRESFAIMSSGEYKLNYLFEAIVAPLSIGYNFYMGHYAKDYNPETIDGVVDNIMLTPYIEYAEVPLFSMGLHCVTFDVRLSYVQSLQRDRINENTWEHPFGGELLVNFGWNGLELSNRLYVGKGSLLSYYNRYGSDVYHGMSLYRTEKGIYDAIALSYSRWFLNNTVGVKAGITAEYDGTGWGTRQWLQVDVTIGNDMSVGSMWRRQYPKKQ